MRVFFSTCPTGLEEPARRLADRVVPGFRAKATMPGAVVYTAKVETPECAGFNNTYLQIARADKCSSIAHAARLFWADRRAISDAERAMRARGFASFRVMFADANRRVAVEKEYREAFERAIRVPNDRMNPATELVISRRSEGSAMLLLRLTKPTAAKKGALTPAVASCLAFLARPEPNGAFLDPFAGSGAVGIARMTLGKSQRIFLADSDAEAVKRLKKRIPSRAEIERLDARGLAERFAPGEFTEIATDPPWGLFKPLEADASAFCHEMAQGFDHALAPYGTCAVLTAMKDEFPRALKDTALTLIERYDILVNGKKAAIFVAKK